MENKEIEAKMKELEVKEYELKKLSEEVSAKKAEAWEEIERVDALTQDNEELLKKVRKANRRRSAQIKFMIVLAVSIVLAATFSAGMVLGRCLAFLNIVGC